ncbi:GTP 3',8-cyclase MoaA [Verrucomicrobiota bacterium]
MLDRYNREINYLRISVIDRCNHRCVYCMPESGVDLKTHQDIFSYEQIEAVLREAVKLGINKVRLTGGEPLLRKGIEKLVEQLSKINGLNELCMTTNGTRLSGMAAKLKEKGLDRVNISIDSLDPGKYREITRGGELNYALTGVDMALDAGLTPIKINMVIFADTTEEEIEEMQDFCQRKGVTLQKIMQFSLYSRDDLIMKFHAERPPKCLECNRLRLTADGFFKPCLFSEDEIKVDFNDIRGSIQKAIEGKPESGSSCKNRSMSAIGG